MTLLHRRGMLGLIASGVAATAHAQAGASDPKARLAVLGIVLPALSAPLGSYAPYAIDGRLLFISGQLPLKDGKLTAAGRVPTEVSLDAGQAAARQCAINILAAANLALGGDLTRVAACLKLTGYVACEPGFTDQPKIINGASDLMKDVFGDRGRHARAAVGVSALPLGAPVEVEAIFSLIA